MYCDTQRLNGRNMNMIVQKNENVSLPDKTRDVWQITINRIIKTLIVN